MVESVPAMAVKTAFITGGASGIGRAFAETLAEQGVEVVLADKGARGTVFTSFRFGPSAPVSRPPPSVFGKK